MPTSRHPSYTRPPTCHFCEHDEEHDLAYWFAERRWECVNSFFCDCRSVARGLWTGAHLQEDA